MLPPALKRLQENLRKEKAATSYQKQVLAELDDLDSTLEKADAATLRTLREGIQKRSADVYFGPKPDSCPCCGRS